MKRKLIFLLSCVIIPLCAHAALDVVPFPMAYSDLPLQDRLKNELEGYKPFLDKKAYIELNIAPGEEIYTDSMIAHIEHNDTQVGNIPTDTNEFVNHDGTPQPNNSNYSGIVTIGGGNVVRNNFVTGQSCYPPDTDRHFVNKILTTGKYENINPAFEKALITVFRKEGRCGTISNDPCGYTCFGIGSSPQCAGVVIKTRPEAENWYYNNIWKKYNLDKIPDVISGDLFLAMMASGPKTAYNQFRQFLGLPYSNTFVIDSDMIHAINAYNGDIHNSWLDKRDIFLQKVAQERYKGKVSAGYKNAIELKRKNGCHVYPQQPLYR